MDSFLCANPVEDLEVQEPLLRRSPTDLLGEDEIGEQEQDEVDGSGVFPSNSDSLIIENPQ